MKGAFVWFLVLASVASADLGVVKPKPDPMAMFSQVMQQSQAQLGKVERHHKKVVNKMRKSVTKVFADESASLSDALGSYAADLAIANAEIGRVVNATKKVLATKDSAVPSASWMDSPDVMDRARLSAHVGAAEREMRKSSRRDTRSLKEAAERAEGPLEDEANKLGYKVGDLSPVFDKAKETIEAHAVPVTGPKVEVAQESKPSKVDGAQLKALEANLATAAKKGEADKQAAGAKLDKVLAQASERFEKKVGDIKKSLDSEQKEEIKKVSSKFLF